MSEQKTPIYGFTQYTDNDIMDPFQHYNSDMRKAETTLAALDTAKVDKAKRTGSDTAYKVLSDNNYTDGDKEQVGKIAELSNPNLLIGGGLNVWQRGTAFTITSGYTADRWVVAAGYALTVTKTDNGARIQAGGGWANFVTFIEDFAFLKGKTVTFSCSITAPSGISIIANNGNVLNKQLGAITTLKETSVTFTVPNDIVSFSIGFQITTGTADINWAKLELGTVATPFVPRPYGEELALCQRYYINFSQNLAEQAYAGDVVAMSETTANGRFHLPASLRITPHSINHIGCYLFDGVTSTKVTEIAAIGTSTNAIEISVKSSNLVPKQFYYLFIDANANGKCSADAEIY